MPNSKKISPKALIFSTYDSNGGASELTYRMAKALIDNGFQVEMLVRHKTTNESFIHVIPQPKINKSFIRRIINKLKRILYIKTPAFKTKPEYAFFPDEDEATNHITADEIINKISFTPDYILAGLTYGFVNTAILAELQKKTGAKTLQVMYDMSSLTGGCHVSWGCEGFKADCNSCPGILNNQFKDYAKTNLELKHKNIKNGNVGLLVPRAWSLFQANSSMLFRNGQKISFNIPLDLDLFTNANRDLAKLIFNIPQNCKVIFAGSNNAKDERKGRKYLVKALDLFWDRINDKERDKIIIILAGNYNHKDEQTSGIKFKKHLMEYIKDYRLLSLVYQASDIYVNPSLEDGGPMMVTEALACGTPVVGFEMGYLFDNTYIKDGYNGYRVKMKDTMALSVAIEKVVLSPRTAETEMNNNARRTALEFFSQKNFSDTISSI